MNLYFIGRSGNFKATVFYDPYFYVDYVDPSGKKGLEIGHFIQRKFEAQSVRVETVEKEDLDLANHLSGKKKTVLKLSFNTVNELMEVRNALKTVILANQKRMKESNGEENIRIVGETTAVTVGDVAPSYKASGTGAKEDSLLCLTDLREHDVTYTMRAAIDLDLRVGAWYVVTPVVGSEECSVVWQKDMLEKCNPTVCAFDIECEKSPLKFPNADRDRIYMISYMISTAEQPQGYLIISRDIVSADIDDFEYTPNPRFPGPFKIFNEQTEEALLRRFIAHMKELKPHVMVTYNGDFFDWPYVDTRCKIHGINLYKELGIRANSGSSGTETEFIGRCMVHLDAFKWVQRDSYLPQGSQGLKAVTKAKLGYNPVEVDAEDMVRLAIERPAHMASYSVSDAVATYYLYALYVHNFIFSLCTIIPLQSEDVLRKGSGTLCESLLMIEAYRLNIICPNKQVDPLEQFHNGHLLESETYIGGHVECLEAGVFRSDLPVKFNLVPSALQQLIGNIDRDLTFALETEHGLQRTDVTNYDEVKQEIIYALELLRDSPNRTENPMIYHIDVGAMYPNIILTNRLQPSAIVSASDCASCDFNRAECECKRPMPWTWRGDYSPASHSEYQNIKRHLTYNERFPVEVESTGAGRGGGRGGGGSYGNNNNKGGNDNGPHVVMKSFSELPEKTQAAKVRERLKAYSQRVYRKSKTTEETERVNTVCMRENPFYVNTVRSFRDRRYDYKLSTKVWKGKMSAAEKSGDALARRQAEDMTILMDSLQLAHKCILNSFYGYVVRKGARWRSMEMAGIVTHTGASLITQARELVEQVGRPLELDTDGIWCVLPSSFPQNYKFLTKTGGKAGLEYPCAMLNADVHERYTNEQYQDLVVKNPEDPTFAVKQFDRHSECSIYFELDGPYKAMILPASAEEGRLLKKKYAVFNYDGSIAELKGFELKRRGELELVKIFQSQVFDQFLVGDSLQDSYDAVGAVANRWLDVLDTKGKDVPDEEMMELISEKKTISKTLEDYEGRKATSLTTAMRLSDFLGAEMVKDKGLNCNLVISMYPRNAPVTDRAIPVAIFDADDNTRRHFLRQWLKEPDLDCDDFRDLIDWDYYRERLSRSVQKIVTIPAGLQAIPNPCPRVEHPKWLTKALAEKLGKTRQMKLDNIFKPAMIRNGAVGGTPGAAGRLLGPATSATAVGLGLSSSKKRGIGGSNSASSAASAVGDMEDLLSGSKNSNIGGGHVISHRAKITLGSSPSGHDQDLQDVQDLQDQEHDRDDDADAGVMTFDPVATEEAAATAVQPINVESPEDMEGFQRWLRARKEQWGQQRAQMRVIRGGSSASSGRRYGVSIKDTLRGNQVGYYNEDGDGGEGLDGGPKKRVMGVVDLVRSAALSVTQGYWQIIELYETGSTPGEFVVFAMTQRQQLQKLTITVPRYMYVNCRDRQAEDVALYMGGKRVTRDLPHGHKIAQCGLYEVKISERRFVRNEKSLASFLSSTSVEGVYETLTPLWLRTVLQIGCITRLSNDAKARGAALANSTSGGTSGSVSGSISNNSTSFSLDDLEFVSSHDFPYLTPKTAKYRKIYLYAVMEKSSRANQLGAVALFILDQHEDGSNDLANANAITGKAYVWLVNSSLTGHSVHQQAKPPMNRLFRKYAGFNGQRQHARAGNGEEMRFNTNYVTSAESAWQQCNDRLEAYTRERHGPTIVFVQGSVSDISSRVWRRTCPPLNDLPVVLLPHNSTDEFFPLTWQMFVAERMLQRLFILPAWLEDRLQSASYCHIPLSNLGRDVTMTMIDVLFARQLHHNKHVLWCSEQSNSGSSNVIDCGGGANDMQEYQLQAIWSDSLKEPIINAPGIYRNVCVEIDITGLAINSIVWSHLLDSEGLLPSVAGNAASENAGGAGNSGGMMGMWGNVSGSAVSDGSTEEVHSSVAASTVTTDASCGRAFILLKALVAQWLHDYKHRNDLHAYSLLSNCYRYLCGGSGNNTLLSDPTIHRIIYGLMIKLFKRLIVELKKLNVNIVYASFSKLIVSATGKHDIAAAEEYISFIIDTVLRKELFQNLEIRIRGYWNQLFWYDANNWCGGRYPCDARVPPTDEGGGDDNVSAEIGVSVNNLVEAIEEEQGEAEVVHVQSSTDSFRQQQQHSQHSAVDDGSDYERDGESGTGAISSPARLPPNQLQLSSFSKAAPQARWQDSQLFSMWSKQSQRVDSSSSQSQGQGQSQAAPAPGGGEFISSVALIGGKSKGRRKPPSNGGKRGKRAGSAAAAGGEDVNMLIDSDDEDEDGGEGSGRNKEQYDFLDSLLQTPAKNTRGLSGLSAGGSELDRDIYSDDEESYSEEEDEDNEPDIKQYGGSNSNRRRGAGSGRRRTAAGKRCYGRGDMSASEDEYDSTLAVGSGAGSGATVRRQQQEVEEELQQEEEVTSPFDFQVEHHWTMTSHLPQPVVMYFEWVVAEYMKIFQQQYEDMSAEPETEAEMLTSGSVAGAVGGSLVPLVPPAGRVFGHGAARHRLRKLFLDEETVVHQVQEQMRAVLTVSLLSDMLSIMDQLREVYGPPGSETARAAFDYSHTTIPDGIGGIGGVGGTGPTALFTDPVLEYVKVCLAVICLDSSLPDEIAALRRGLLSQLKIREFSAQSEFVDYNASYILSDVICNYCNNCRDIDMLRDFKPIPAVGESNALAVTQTQTQSQGHAPVLMLCNQCHHQYDRVLIENKLLAEVNRLHSTYLLQDIRCPKTHKISNRLCTAMSELCAPLVLDISQQTMRSQLLLLLHVANYHNFTLLIETIEQYL